MAHREIHPGGPLPLHPAAQQRRRLEIARINTAIGCDEGFHSEVSRPLTHGGGIKFREERRPQLIRLFRAGVAGGKLFARLSAGEVQSAATSDEKLPAHRRLGLEQRHCCAAGRRHFGCAQAGRATADNCDFDAELKQTPPRHATVFAKGK